MEWRGKWGSWNEWSGNHSRGDERDREADAHAWVDWEPRSRGHDAIWSSHGRNNQDAGWSDNSWEETRDKRLARMADAQRTYEPTAVADPGTHRTTVQCLSGGHTQVVHTYVWPQRPTPNVPRAPPGSETAVAAAEPQEPGAPPGSETAVAEAEPEEQNEEQPEEPNVPEPRGPTAPASQTAVAVVPPQSTRTWDIVQPLRPQPWVMADNKHDIQYFRRWDMFSGHWKQHSATLKYLREELEAAGLTQKIFDGAEEIAEIDHPPGMEYTFDRSKTHHWFWQELVAQLTDCSLEIFFNHGNDRSRGEERSIVNCCIQKQARYDHKRHYADRVAGRQETTGETELKQIWDFVFTRSDGTIVRLHPNWSSTKVGCSFGVGMDNFEPRDIPRTGPGGTSGPGTYSRLTRKNIDVTLKFDANKKPQTAKAKAKSTTGKAKATPKAPQPPQSRSSWNPDMIDAVARANASSSSEPRLRNRNLLSVSSLQDTEDEENDQAWPSYTRGTDLPADSLPQSR